MEPEMLVRLVELLTLPDDTTRDPTPDELESWMHGGEE
jgi:hypothetical protein